MQDTFDKYLEKIAKGEARPVPLPWPLTSALTQALVPGATTILCGNPGAGKTYLLLQAANYWRSLGVPVGMLELEESVNHYQLRVMAQCYRDARLTQRDHIESLGPEEALALAKGVTAELDWFKQSLAVPATAIALNQVTDYVREQVKAGKRIVVVDPITAADNSSDPVREENLFLQRTKKVIEDSPTSLVISTHPRKDASEPSMSQLANAAGYSRFTQTILWLERLPEQVMNPMKTVDDQAAQMIHGHVLHILKARNGYGSGMTLAFDMNELVFTEFGIIIKAQSA